MSTLSASPPRSFVPSALRILGAVALLVSGAVHLQQYLGAGYRNIPTIGTLFLLNAIAAGIVGLAILLRASALLVLLGVAIAVGALVSLIVSLSTPIFGFMETQTNLPVSVALASEAAAILLLGASLGQLRRSGRASR